MALLLILFFGSPFSFAIQGHKVIVAVVDTGVDITHPDLKEKLWKDHQGNSGWDFVSNSPNIVDFHGHGTHIAGIIAGMAKDIEIMPVRYYDVTADGSVNLSNTIKSLNYAIDHGAQIINYSGGGPEYSEDEFQAIKRAQDKGILVVAAAGNDHKDTDLSDNRYYPAAYEGKGLKNIITVASINNKNELLASSNWGHKSVDVAAPGQDILSTLPGGRYGKMSGTSQAAAFVSGVAAEVLSRYPDISPVQIKDFIVKHVTQINSLHGKTISGGKVEEISAR
jgi:subtilisin family serine protease